MTVAIAATAAISLLVPAVSGASMAGAPPATTSFRPDLRSVHVFTGITGGRAQFCFDKPLNTPAARSAASFALGGYRWDSLLVGTGDAVLDTNPACALATMPSADLKSYTFGTVLPGAVVAAVSGGTTNLADSAPNIDSKDHTGTAGHTTGPDLVGITVGAPAGTNEIDYSFDQPVDKAALDPTKFGYTNAAGVNHTGVAITGVDSAGNVRVAFGAVTTGDAVNAWVTRGGTFTANTPGASQTRTKNPETVNPTENVAVAGTSGTTAAPGLTAAALQGTNQIAFTFDQPIACFTSCAFVARNFVAVTSNGDEITAGSATVQADGKTVLATFNAPNITNLLEEVTVASVNPLAVVNPNNSLANPPAGKPVGGNSGAFATGFTNGPDATRVTFDSATGQVVVNFDQRIAANGPGQPVAQDGTTAIAPGTHWFLLDSLGSPVAAPTTATVEPLGPYMSDVRLTFTTPSLVGAAKSLEVCGNQASSGLNPYAGFGGTTPAGCGVGAAVFSFGTAHGTGAPGMNPAGNVQQLIAPTASAVAFHDPARGRLRVVWQSVHITARRTHAGHHRRRTLR